MRNTVVVQITRGVCPARSIADASKQARAADAHYVLVEGMPAPDAKRRAAYIALDLGYDLILCEDDFVASNDQWITAVTAGDQVCVGSAIMRNGKVNTRYTPSGRVLYSGTVFVRVPIDVLRRLAAKGPLFVPWIYNPSDDGESLIAQMPNPEPWGSDVHFWASVNELDPRPTIVDLGLVTHFRHIASDGPKANLDNAVLLEPYTEAR